MPIQDTPAYTAPRVDVLPQTLAVAAIVVEGEIVGAEVQVRTSSTRLARDAPLMPVPDVDADTAHRLGEHLLNAIELSRRALADNTLRNYNQAWTSFCTWCDARGVLALPASPATVQAYLVSRTFAYDKNHKPLEDEAGKPVRGELRPQSATLHLTAINRFHRANNHPTPGDDETVKNVMAAVRRTFGLRRDQRKAAIDRPMLERILIQLRAPDPGVVRDRVLMMLGANSAGAGPLARLCVGRLELTRREAVVRLPSPTRSALGEVILRLPATGDPGTCPVEVLRAQVQRIAGDNPLVRPEAPLLPSMAKLDVDPADAAMTKQGIAAAMARLALAAGVPSLADLDHEGLRQALRQMARPTSQQIRDEALLSTGWIAALRRSSQENLNWGELTVEEDRIVGQPRWSKTNQEGTEDDELVIPCGVDPAAIFDPGRAFLAWRALVAGEVGGAPELVCPDQPVWVPIDRHGNFERTKGGKLARLSGEAINALVQQHVAALGIDSSRYGSHSLRIGLVTQALRDGLSVSAVQTITKHKSVEVLLAYNRAEQRRLNDPARKLLSRAADSS